MFYLIINIFPSKLVCFHLRTDREEQVFKYESLKGSQEAAYLVTRQNKPRPSTFCLPFLLSLFIVLNWFSTPLVSTMFQPKLGNSVIYALPTYQFFYQKIFNTNKGYGRMERVQWENRRDEHMDWEGTSLVALPWPIPVCRGGGKSQRHAREPLRCLIRKSHTGFLFEALKKNKQNCHSYIITLV